MKRGRSPPRQAEQVDVEASQESQDSQASQDRWMSRESGSPDNSSTQYPKYHKYQRIERNEDQDNVNEEEIIWCSLAPHCSAQPTACYNIEELESHYVRFHAFVCRAEGCSCVFEREHYLNLHQTEFHDPLAQLRKERGESIYQCLLPECHQFFPSPHQRKRHLISEHHFEDTFFFGVTKYGIGDQIRAWGSGERRSLAPNKEKDAGNKKRKEATKSKGDSAMEVEIPTPQTSQTSPQTSKQSLKKQNRRSVEVKPSDDMVEDVSVSMSKLSMVPTTVQFGRGGAKGGFEKRSKRTSSQSLSLITNLNTDTEQERETTQGQGQGQNGQNGNGNGIADTTGIDDSPPDESPERDSGSLGVRFSEDVAIRFLSPVDHRYNEGRRGKKRYGGSGSGSGSGKRGGRTGGVHSDDESGSRHKQTGDRDRDRDRAHASRGRARGRGRGGGGSSSGGGGGGGGSERPSSSHA